MTFFMRHHLCGTNPVTKTYVFVFIFRPFHKESLTCQNATPSKNNGRTFTLQLDPILKEELFYFVHIEQSIFHFSSQVPLGPMKMISLLIDWLVHAMAVLCRRQSEASNLAFVIFFFEYILSTSCGSSSRCCLIPCSLSALAFVRAKLLCHHLRCRQKHSNGCRFYRFSCSSGDNTTRGKAENLCVIKGRGQLQRRINDMSLAIS